MCSQALVRDVTRLVLPQRLASIQSLELVWTNGPAKAPLVHGDSDSGEKDLCWLCDALPELFPQLKKLHLSLCFSVSLIRSLGPDGELLSYSAIDTERALLGPVEAMWVRFPHVSQTGGELSIEIDADFWEVLLRKHDAMRTPGLRAETDYFMNWGRFWKRLPGQQIGGDHDAGYWVCTGQHRSRIGRGSGDWGDYDPGGDLLCPHVRGDIDAYIYDTG